MKKNIKVSIWLISNISQMTSQIETLIFLFTKKAFIFRTDHWMSKSAKMGPSTIRSHLGFPISIYKMDSMLSDIEKFIEQ